MPADRSPSSSLAEQFRALADAATPGSWDANGTTWTRREAYGCACVLADRNTRAVTERAQHTIVAELEGVDGDKRWEWGVVHHPEYDAAFIAFCGTHRATIGEALAAMERVRELPAKWRDQAERINDHSEGHRNSKRFAVRVCADDLDAALGEKGGDARGNG
jgi:hypothetical protein